VVADQSNEKFLEWVASSIRDSLVLEPFKLDRKIFLCGASPQTRGAIRGKVAKLLKERPKHFWYDQYDIYYPETIFDGLMAGPNRFDVLTLENMLAEAVDAVILILESPGTMTELGAFANHPQLRKRLVVIQDQKFRKTRSFIRQGPIRLLQDRHEGQVVYLDFTSIEKDIEEIHRAVRRVIKANPVKFTFGNVLHAHHFVVPCLFVLEQASRQEIAALIQSVAKIEQAQATIVASAAIAILLRDRKIVIEGTKVRLSDQGVKDFIVKGRWERSRPRYSRSAIDKLRIGVLTRQRKRLRSWA